MRRLGVCAFSPRRIRVGHPQPPIGAERCVLAERGSEVQRRLGEPRREARPGLGLHRCPASRPVPVVDENFRRAGHVTRGDAPRRNVGKGGNLGVGGTATGTDLAQNMERRRLIQREAGDPIDALQGRGKRHRAAVGVADEMDRLAPGIDRCQEQRFVSSAIENGAPAGQCPAAAVPMRLMALTSKRGQASDVSLRHCLASAPEQWMAITGAGRVGMLMTRARSTHAGDWGMQRVRRVRRWESPNV